MVRPRVARGFVNLADAVLHQCMRIRPLIGACYAPGYHGHQRAFDADHGDRCVEFLRYGVLLVLSAPCQPLALAGPEHGRTIPFDMEPGVSEFLSLSQLQAYAGRVDTAIQRAFLKNVRSEVCPRGSI